MVQFNSPCIREMKANHGDNQCKNWNLTMILWRSHYSNPSQCEVSDTRPPQAQGQILGDSERCQMLKLELLKKTDFQKAPRVKWKKKGSTRCFQFTTHRLKRSTPVLLFKHSLGISCLSCTATSTVRNTAFQLNIKTQVLIC